jgi:predicted DNA-binding protein (MmcQ/YjbR family)
MSYLEQLREIALAFPGAAEEWPWENHPVWKAANRKIFVMAGDDDAGVLNATVKLDHDAGQEALTLPFVTKAAYVGRFGWVSAHVTNDFEFEVLAAWVARSHELVGPKARKAAKPRA